jgi:hypothetical protein
LAASCHEHPVIPPAPPAPAIVVRAEVPDDVPGGAERADLRTAGRFAWQQFIAMNWPAKDGVRETADPQKKFGQPGGAVVWETLRSKVEVYPGDGSATVMPHGAEKGAPDYGYDDPPLYIYSATDRPSGEVPPCVGQAPVSTPARVNLDEISQVGFDHLFAGGHLVHYSSKANRINYRYVVENKYWYDAAGAPYLTAMKNFTDAVANNAFPPAKPYVSFPSGTIEVKTAFRPLTPAEAASGRFYMTTVRFYERGASDKGCYREARWGLLGLHIVQKTPTAPAFTWATFEQADNLAAEDQDGDVTHAVKDPNNPPLSYQDGPYRQGVLPIVRKNGPFCTNPDARLYYREIDVDAKGNPYANTPSGGNICVEGRMHRIPPVIVEVNREAHRAIAEYESGRPPSPWRYYKLVNVQTYPFDKSQIVTDDDSPHGAPAYYTANIAVESDYTLQNHSGGPETKTGAAPSDLTINFVKYPQPPALPFYQNTYVLRSDGSLTARYNMGGCTGCHGLTQVIAGSDYSYLLSGSSVSDPEFPETPARTLAARYNRRFP